MSYNAPTDVLVLKIQEGSSQIPRILEAVTPPQSLAHLAYGRLILPF